MLVVPKISNYIQGFVQEPQKTENFFFLMKSKIDRLGRLGSCVCQTKKNNQRWVQQLVHYQKHFFIFHNW